MPSVIQPPEDPSKEFHEFYRFLISVKFLMPRQYAKR